jgi:hypothetical protein
MGQARGKTSAGPSAGLAQGVLLLNRRKTGPPFSSLTGAGDEVAKK